ncbi:cupin domain-containing protein [Myxococcus landrumensis]|uniref:Cupin domain-containing protein n=1 Tax=Myxococcus landrumensis TaxID=2813577 RepID=A0ABX7N3L3_9BACT|nr:cupin domain-containing protein [Myxococcus landrumus]QSQ12184.1 cupin domain-containing protein [Myxococcus landrumus]
MPEHHEYPPTPPWMSVRVDDIEPLVIGPGCLRRDLPSTRDVRAWVVDMAPGSQWPWVDVHDTGEEVFVVSGELIEGAQRLGPGSYLFFAPGSSHQPRTELGVRLFGINPIPPKKTGDTA